MRAIAPFVLQVIALQLTGCRGGGGGPSIFGYDASSACGKPHSRAGRAHHHELPCDFRRQNWCTTAGSSYPWLAVRRFVQANQGLMRRMYGDESYINVLKAEFDKNDIELKYEDYHHHFVDDLRQFQYENDDYEPIEDDTRSFPDEYEGRVFVSRSINDPIPKRLNKFPKLSEYTRPHFKPTEQSTDGSTSSSSTTTTTTSSPTSIGVTSSDTRTSYSTIRSLATSTKERGINVEPLVTSTALSNATATTATATATTVKTTDDDVTTSSTPTTTSSSVTVAQIVREQNFILNEIPGQNDRLDEGPKVTAEAVMEEEKDATSESAGTTSFPMKSPAVNEERVELVKEKVLGATKTTTVTVVDGASSSFEQQQQQQFRPRPEYRPSSVAPGETSNMSGQLYQDVAAKDQQEQPVLKLRGVNACPVKEEVVAPFWANNTRGEVLALLNLYPFEQYVHWEKCTNENKQMYCRDGCRCEQQYRLHRLLAYDPNNECRGIFSDWFKFPSCCVCRCYDLPLEFRVTSRSPRNSLQKRRIKVQAPRDRYA